MDFDKIAPFIRGVSLMKWTFDNSSFSIPYDCRIFAIYEGNAILTTKHGKYQLKSGSIMFFGPTEPYKFKNADENSPFILLTVNLDLTQNRRDIDHFVQPATEISFDESKILDRQDIPELSKPIILRDAGDLTAKVHLIYNEYQSGQPFCGMRLSALATDLLVEIVRGSSGGNSRRERLISSIKSYIYDNFHSKIDNEMIAAELGYHPYYLSRIFKESEGVSLHQYVINYRLKSAAQMLQTTVDPVELIAESCGFSSHAQFSASFKAKYGMIPSEFRHEKN